MIFRVESDGIAGIFGGSYFLNIFIITRANFLLTSKSEKLTLLFWEIDFIDFKFKIHSFLIN
jgi:hypothetical protein